MPSKKKLLLTGMLVVTLALLFFAFGDDAREYEYQSTEIPQPALPAKQPQHAIADKSPPAPALQSTSQESAPATQPAAEAPPAPAPGTGYILCEHIVSGESRYEFFGEIRLINTGGETITGWSVSWEYSDGSTLTQSSNVALAGSNPYTGEHLAWNAEIEPGKTVTFSFTGLKGGDTAPMSVEVTGDFCLQPETQSAG